MSHDYLPLYASAYHSSTLLILARLDIQIILDYEPVDI
jgi:hypothetical protein